MAELEKIMGKSGAMTVAAEFLFGAGLFALTYRLIAGRWPWQ